MNSIDISEALNYMSDDILEEARTYTAPLRRSRVLEALACVACFALILTAVLTHEPEMANIGDMPSAVGDGAATMESNNSGTPESPAEAPGMSVDFILPESNTPERSIGETVNGLPVLSPKAEESGGMGFEGLLAYDISELMPTSPVGEGVGIDTLPVYRNPLWIEREENGAPVFYGTDWEKMMEVLLDTAALFGYGESDLNFRAGEQDLFGYNAMLNIEVGSDMLVRVELLQPEYLDGASMSYYTSLEGVEFCAEYLLENYAHLLGMEKPAYIITGGDYTIHSQQGYDIIFYDTAGTPEQQLQNRYFRYAEFKFDENGKLWFFNARHSDLSRKLGDYPIITAEEALERLAKGEYITSVYYDFPGVEYAARTELVYRADSAWGGDYMPYYRILVELPELYGQHMELKTYGSYYVPAVESQYLTDARTWNGEFNT